MTVLGIIIIIGIFVLLWDHYSVRQDLKRYKKNITIVINRIEHHCGFGTYGISEKVHDFLLDYGMDEIHFKNHFVEDAISKAIDEHRKKHPLEHRPSAYQPDGINEIEYL